MKTNNLADLEKKLKTKFKKQSLLTQALVHRSFLNEPEGKDIASNERLEFLGDAVISLVISHWIYEEFPDFPEGHLTNIRSNLVKTESLAMIAQKLGVGDYLLLSRGEIKSGGNKNPSLLADSFEAIIGAIFLDQGIGKVEEIIHTNLLPKLREIIESRKFKGYKNILQEKLQAETKESPLYKIIGERGPDHAKEFTVGVWARNEMIALGLGKTKKEAEEQAAKNALEKINLKG